MRLGERRGANAAAIVAACYVAAWTAPARAGSCERDTDCKGDRVCEQGQCVDPVPAALPKSADGSGFPGGVRVTIESNRPDATLARVTGSAVAFGSNGATAEATSYEVVCAVPCNKALDRNAKYVFQGVAGLGSMSGEFTLPSRDAVQLKVNSGSQGFYVLGAVGAAVSAAVLGLGGGFWIGGAATGSDDLRSPGMVMTLASAPVLVVSLILLVANGTDVTTDKGEHLASGPAGSPGPASPNGVGVFF